MTPAEMKTNGLLVTKLGALYIQLADAEETGDNIKAVELLRQIQTCFNAFTMIFQAHGLPTEAIRTAADASSTYGNFLEQEEAHTGQKHFPETVGETVKRLIAAYMRTKNHIARCQVCLKKDFCLTGAEGFDKVYDMMDHLSKLVSKEQVL